VLQVSDECQLAVPSPWEKANDDSLLGAVEHFEKSKREAFSVKKGVVLRDRD
jgi:hypothetical protein